MHLGGNGRMHRRTITAHCSQSKVNALEFSMWKMKQRLQGQCIGVQRVEMKQRLLEGLLELSAILTVLQW